MVDTLLIALTIFVISLLFFAVFFLVRWIKASEPETRKPDYRVFFILGVTWIPLGVALDMPVFWILGIVYVIIGLANRDKWLKERS